MSDSVMKIWLPRALYIGISEDRFWHMNPRKMKPYEKAQEMREQYADILSWNVGRYIQIAIGAAFSEKNKYPDKAFSMNKLETPQEHDYSVDAMRFEQWAIVANEEFRERHK